MARTGENENKSANADYKAQQGQAFKTGQGAIAEGENATKILRQGGDIGANPWASAKYQGAVNRLSADSLNQGTSASKGEVEGWNRRTGGLNSGVVPATMSALNLGKTRLADQLSSERYAQDTDKNVNYQQQLLQDIYQPAALESPYYGTATSGRGGALNNLTQFGLASYGPWMAAIQAVGGAAAGALKH